MNHTIPTFEEHQNWFKNNVQHYYKGCVGDINVGCVRFVDTDIGIEVSIYVHPKHRGKKLSVEMLSKAVATRGDFDKMYATIQLRNVVSFKVFASVSGLMQ